jgi:hypothetical protein
LIKNFSKIETFVPSVSWKQQTEIERITKIQIFLEKNILYKDLKVLKANNNGQVIIHVNTLLAANERGNYLLDLESILKKKIDQGITIWSEVVADKSKLRQLRGVKIKT